MFNIRVYGVLINDKKQVLVSDEFMFGAFFTKFCGGGLEFGEGTKDCLVREFMEEMRLRITVKEHIYTTDYFQPSAFNKQHQIISIYYRVEADELPELPCQSQPLLYSNEETLPGTELQKFRFVDWIDFSAEQLTLPIDKIVADLIKKNL